MTRRNSFNYWAGRYDGTGPWPSDQGGSCRFGGGGATGSAGGLDRQALDLLPPAVQQPVRLLVREGTVEAANSAAVELHHLAPEARGTSVKQPVAPDPLEAEVCSYGGKGSMLALSPVIEAVTGSAEPGRMVAGAMMAAGTEGMAPRPNVWFSPQQSQGSPALVDASTPVFQDVPLPLENLAHSPGSTVLPSPRIFRSISPLRLSEEDQVDGLMAQAMLPPPAQAFVLASPGTMDSLLVSPRLRSTADAVRGCAFRGSGHDPSPASTPGHVSSVQTLPPLARHLSFEDMGGDPPLMARAAVLEEIFEALSPGGNPVGARLPSPPADGQSHAGPSTADGPPSSADRLSPPWSPVRSALLVGPALGVAHFDRVYVCRKESVPAPQVVELAPSPQPARRSPLGAVILGQASPLRPVMSQSQASRVPDGSAVDAFIVTISTPPPCSLLGTPPASVPVTRSRRRVELPRDFTPWRSPRLALQGDGARRHTISKVQRVTMKKLGIIEEEDEATQETAEQYMCLFDNPLPSHHVEAMAELLQLDLAEPMDPLPAEPTMALVASPA